MVHHFLLFKREYHLHQICPTSALQNTTFIHFFVTSISTSTNLFNNCLSNILHMKLKRQVHFQLRSLLAPWRLILRIFKSKRLFFIRALRYSKHQSEPKTSPPRKLHTGLKSFFKSPRHKREMDKLTSRKSFQKAPCPSPLTPAYVRMSMNCDHNEELLAKEDADEACRSFEKHLMDMIVVEGELEHLVDVEEVLYNWNSLKCPIFMDLVSRFYGELCKDSFDNRDENMVTLPPHTSL